MEIEELLKKALETRELSYSPYSNFKVGAALLTKDGKVFTGTNIENCSYGLSMCAERNALFNAYVHGYKKNDFINFVVVADTKEPCSPCGACRQVLSELYPSSAPIYLASTNGKIKKTNINELLPDAFDGEDLK